MVTDARATIIPRKRPGPLKRIAENPWSGFLARRFVSLMIILLVLSLAVFFMVRLVPGDPVLNAFGLDTPPDRIQAIKQEWGISGPLSEQLQEYYTNLLHGNLGNAFATQQPVSEIIRQRIGASLELAIAALVLVLVGGVSIGMLAAAFTRDGKRPKAELSFGGITTLLGSTPDYVWATLLVFVFAVTLRWLPVAGAGTTKQLVLPTLAIAIPLTAHLVRIVRVETLNVLAQDYVRTARSERLPGWRIYLRHVLPNVLTAALTIGGLIFAGLIGGAVVVENVFARPGLGTALVTAVVANDYPVVQGITLVLGLTVVFINTSVDVVLGVLDPRSLTKDS